MSKFKNAAVIIYVLFTLIFSDCRSQAISSDLNDTNGEIVGSISTDTYWEFNPSISPDGKTLIFARSKENFKNPKIYISQLKGDNWLEPKLISFADSLYDDSDPTFSSDGKHIYFVSNRKSKGTDIDIWRSDLVNKKWTEPIWMGASINSEQTELGPLAIGNQLFFSSNRKANQFDIYVADLKNNTAVSFNDSINSPAMESDIEFTKDNKRLLFWSNRKGGKGRGDIYSATQAINGDWRTYALGLINTAHHEFSPSFSPDGKWIYFARSVKTDKGQVCDIYRIRNEFHQP
jgi:Tol biopolymer transport system component